MAALIGFVALAVLTLHAILFTTGTHVAGYDYFNYHWNFWWIRHASTTPGLNIYLNDFAMFPAMSNYGYHALAAVWYPLWAVFEPLVGTLTVFTGIIFLVCVLNGYMTYLLLRDEGVTPALAFIGGAALQIFPIARYFYYNTHLNLMDWFWIPVALLTWKQIVKAAEARRIARVAVWVILFGAQLYGILLTDLQFPIFVAFALTPYALRSFVLVKRSAIPWLIAAGAGALILAVALAWFAGPLPHILRFEGELVPGPAEDRPSIAIPGGLFGMAQGWWNWSEPSYGAFIPLVILGALILSVTRWRRHMPRMRWFWLVVMLPPFIFALGPTLMIGEAAVPLPYHILHVLTNGMFRMPWRLAPIAVIAGMAFAGLALTPLWTRLVTRQRLIAASAAMLVMALAVRLGETAPLTPVPYPYQFYEDIGRETGGDLDRYMILDVPTAAATGEVILGDPRAVQLQWYGLTHHKRTFNGFISRAPIDQFWGIMGDDPLMAWLGQRAPLDQGAVETRLRDRIFNYPIGYVVIHTDLIGRETATIQEIVGYFNQLDDLLCHHVTEGAAIVYRTRWHPLGCEPRTPPQDDSGAYVIDVGTLGDERYIGWGWHWSEQVSGLTLRWAGEYDRALLYADLPPRNYTLTVSAQAFWEDRQLSVTVNGESVGEPVTVTIDALHEYTFSVPESALGDGQHVEIALVYDSVIVPNQVGQSADPRRLSISVDWVRLAGE